LKAKIILISLLFITKLSTGQSRIENFDSLFVHLKNQNDFNGNVLIADQGKIIYKKSFGYSDFANKKQLNENTKFNIASLSKQFTAMAILMLKEDNKLQLTDNLTKYFPQLPYHDITIQNLLTHTSGLPDYMELFDKQWDKSKIATNKDIVTLLSKYQPLAIFKANEQYEYSNTGYALLGLIIEKVSHVSYAKYLKRKIFDPLKMTRTEVYFKTESNKKLSNLAVGNVLNKNLNAPVLPDSLDEWNFVFYLDQIIGDGSIASTTVDLFKWDRALYSNKLVKKATLDEAYTPQSLNDGTLSHYGFGWELAPNNFSTGMSVYHIGHWPGYGAYIKRFIEKDKTIIVLRNLINYSKRANGIPDVYTNILFNQPFELPKIGRP